MQAAVIVHPVGALAALIIGIIAGVACACAAAEHAEGS